MPRRSVSTQRRDVRDARYRDPLAGRFINSMLLRGKKSLAARTFYQALDYLDGKGEGEPIDDVPQGDEQRQADAGSEVPSGRRLHLPGARGGSRRTAARAGDSLAAAVRRARRGRSMAERLGAELLDAYNNTGSAAKKKEDTHRMAEANRAFAHYRW
ncbi:30S ribosomal protein S7 [Geodia barretti]|uniref:30S ribosomal protein S7 n=1 Tax=Geodia barretti TaxID=519541 RepID=A0AA35WWR4_GEOBA|nr:30S ribosomal protein S7 [Geodia barretti]